tara:strand:+ start:243 stop:428 length:186 start_codon:yes stop_codon:yes gene_type:complete
MGKFHKGIYNCKEYQTGNNRFDVIEEKVANDINPEIYIQSGIALFVTAVCGVMIWYVVKNK